MTCRSVFVAKIPCNLRRAQKLVDMGALVEAFVRQELEPGLYFKADDLLAPEEFRGNGVRIEDDLVITEDGCDVLSKHFPSTSADVEDWIKRLQSS